MENCNGSSFLPFINKDDKGEQPNDKKSLMNLSFMLPPFFTSNSVLFDGFLFFMSTCFYQYLVYRFIAIEDKKILSNMIKFTSLLCLKLKISRDSTEG